MGTLSTSRANVLQWRNFDSGDTGTPGRAVLQSRLSRHHFIHGNRRGAPSRIRVGSLSSIPAMACVARNRAGVPVIAAYHYIRRVRFSRRARIPNVVAHHGGHVGVFRSLCCSGGLCLGSFYAASACLSSCSIHPSAVCAPLILVPISFVIKPTLLFSQRIQSI